MFGTPSPPQRCPRHLRRTYSVSPGLHRFEEAFVDDCEFVHRLFKPLIDAGHFSGNGPNSMQLGVALL